MIMNAFSYRKYVHTSVATNECEFYLQYCYRKYKQNLKTGSYHYSSRRKSRNEGNVVNLSATCWQVVTAKISLQPHLYFPLLVDSQQNNFKLILSPISDKWQIAKTGFEDRILLLFVDFTSDVCNKIKNKRNWATRINLTSYIQQWFYMKQTRGRNFTVLFIGTQLI